jgi:hypothetical protein
VTSHIAFDSAESEGHNVVNERKTEKIVRDHFASDQLAGADLQIEEQASADSTINRLLRKASKSGGRGIGKPEFLVHHPDHPGFLVIVECKADAKCHESSAQNKPKDFAVDGALHYARFLSAKFDVIAVAVSGEDPATMKVSTFKVLRGETAHEMLVDAHGPVERLLTFDEYLRLRLFDKAVRRRTQSELMAWSRILHNFMRDYAKLSEQEKPLVVSGALIALQDIPFARNFEDYHPADLPEEMLSAIDRVFKRTKLPDAKRTRILAPYDFIATHPELARVPGGESQTPLRKIVSDIDEHVRPFLANYHDIDVLGQFYGEFLRYTGGDKKGLGIVLTPRHITQLFAKLASVGPMDTVLDPAAGTAGFLIAAMAEMDAKAGADLEARKRIRSEGLVGIEQQPPMYALAASNMLLRGDGKANLYADSCFSNEVTKALISPGRRAHPQPNVGFVNPPYSQKGAGLHELDFVKHMLDYLVSGGTGIAIVPMSCAIEPHALRSQILANHTLVAVMSMPDELFYPVATVPCIMIFKAHQPHHQATTGTWFGYWKDDGFVKTRTHGRIDQNQSWSKIMDNWLDGFFNKRERAGQSVIKTVTDTDEWCAEAYMETDYSQLGPAEFEEVLRRYVLFRASDASGIDPNPIQNDADFPRDAEA